MHTNHTCFLILIFIFLSLLTFALACTDTERQALLGFKQGLTDPSGRLSSWTGNNCCQWAGVGCNNVSGHVTKLDLRNTSPFISYNDDGIPFIEDGEFTAYERSCLGGKLNHSLVDLKYLDYLDLSLNDFEGIRIPEYFGMLNNLKYLNLSFSSFGGDITPRLGNLSNLNYLDLYSVPLSSLRWYELQVENLEWLSNLPSLKFLNMRYVNLNNTGAEWLQAVNMLPSLLELHLSGCKLQSIPLKLSYVNFTSLSVLDLSGNYFNSLIPNWIFNLTSLTVLHLRGNSFGGAIPEEVVNLMSVEYLDLSYNHHIEGQLPGFIGKLCKLRTLGFSGNSFTGKTDEFFSGFSGCLQNSLVSLDLSENELEGELPDSLGILESLQQLQLGNNSFWGSFPASIGRLSSLQELDVSENKMNGTIPESFGQLFNLTELYLYGNPWSAVITESHLMNLTRLQHVSLSIKISTSFVFNVSNEWVPPFRLISLYLDNCLVGPRFPTWLRVQNELTFISLNNAGIADVIPGEWFSALAPQITDLDLSNNQIKGKLPAELKFPKLTFIDLSNNSFEGSFPLCTMRSLEGLSLRNNQISGELPHCRNESQTLLFLDVANNNLSGNIPSSIGLLTSLHTLILSNNSLVGEIPPSLQNCSLVSIDLGGNRLSGQLPRWIGEYRTKFRMIRLSSNFFTGTIPKQWCNLSLLHILDLAHNNLSGVIPSCLGNLTSLIYDNSTLLSMNGTYFDEEMTIVAKGQELLYSRTLRYVNSIDVSRNSLMGEIPQEITNLIALGTLNLSMNHLTGSIPGDIGKIWKLETLDLSNNNLSGPIPQSISSLTFLSHLNLSFNSLVGRIPSGNQLQTLNDSSIYAGNPSLCGAPIAIKCPGDETTLIPSPTDQDKDNKIQDDDDDRLITLGFYASVVLGFALGFWGVFGTILLNRMWGSTYFKLLENMTDWIYVTTIVNMARLQRKLWD